MMHQSKRVADGNIVGRRICRNRTSRAASRSSAHLDRLHFDRHHVLERVKLSCGASTAWCKNTSHYSQQHSQLWT